MKLYDLILSTAEKGIKIQREDGSMPPGENGIYSDPETPVRNTSHWLIIFIKAYDETKDKRFKNSANNCADFLLTEKARPYGYTFQHRTSSVKKNKCNGLIGQAWTIEALSIAGNKLNRPELNEMAESVFLLHPFNHDFGVWKSVEVTNKQIGYDTTLNHQIWFAASGSLLKNRKINNQIEIFLKNLPQNLETYKSGLIYHPIGGSISLLEHISKSSKKLNREYSVRIYKNRIKRILRRLRNNKSLRQKSVGYHSFNLYALAILHQKFPSNSFWSSSKFASLLRYIRSEEYQKNLQKNKFGFKFNLVGFENAFAEQQFSEDSAESKKWIKLQFEKMINPDGSLKQTITDSKTYQARLYEATRLDNYEIKFSEQE